MKEWPETGPVRFEDLVRPVVKAIKFAYKLQRKNKGKQIPYDGYDRPSLLATCHTVEESLSPETLKYFKEEVGIGPLEVLVSIAVQLGYEQGRREAEEKYEKEKKLLFGLLEKQAKWTRINTKTNTNP